MRKMEVHSHTSEVEWTLSIFRTTFVSRCPKSKQQRCARKAPADKMSTRWQLLFTFDLILHIVMHCQQPSRIDCFPALTTASPRMVSSLSSRRHFAVRIATGKRLSVGCPSYCTVPCEPGSDEFQPRSASEQNRSASMRNRNAATSSVHARR